MDSALRKKITERSGGLCEAEEWLPRNKMWQRCGREATEVHHMLTKARGGRNLDRVGETYHLIHLCSECHRLCDGEAAYEGGMLIEGSCTWDKLRNRPRYQGTDLYLTRHYGKRANQALPIDG